MEKRNRSVSRKAERTIVREHSRTYKDDVANFSSSSSIYHKYHIIFYLQL
ncbi:MAG TPA: palindromic element RPE5 domain-containing protein [Rickettsia endosymbiont of Pyrocoelia pectoralis]|nr:palindromic element RPE5 domain-containing protein [Rickettsia endosymbiont of Pyrocoelia pectoralis]